MAKTGNQEPSVLEEAPARQDAEAAGPKEGAPGEKHRNDDGERANPFSKLYIQIIISHRNQISDLDLYVDPSSKSRCGKIFSPENLLAKNKVDSLRPFRDQGSKHENAKVSPLAMTISFSVINRMAVSPDIYGLKAIYPTKGQNWKIASNRETDVLISRRSASA